MNKEMGRGIGALLDPRPGHDATPEQAVPTRRIRTTITLTQEDADRLELLRMQLRRDRGRGLTYSEVVSQALHTLADAVNVPSLSRSET